MTESKNGTKVEYSKDVGKAQYILYKKTYERIERARKQGFHIEAIALTESLICDRLEALKSVLSGFPTQVSTIGRLLKAISPLEVLSPELTAELRDWNSRRGLAIHQFPKVITKEEVSWAKRLSFSREISRDGLVVLKKLRKETDGIIRSKR